MPHEEALLVIDMQNGMFDEPRHDAAGVIGRINAIAGALRGVNAPVIFIQHDGPVGEPFEPGTDGWQLCADLERKPDDPVVHKTTCDAFYATDLNPLLDDLGVTRLLISGCATDFCVDTTLRAAASRDFAISAVADGHTTTDRPDLDAASVIRHHNWVWQNLIVPGAPVEVVAAADLVERFRGDDRTQPDTEIA